MPQDFANRRKSTARSGRKGPRSRPNQRSAKITPRRYFHGPSFSGGVVLGAIIVIGTAYLPELLPGLLQRSTDLQRDAGADPAPAAAGRTSVPELRFEFDEMLPRDVVDAVPENYADPEERNQALRNIEIFLQAGSFRTQREAEQLRAQLMLKDLPVATAPVELGNGLWIRVTVGPFYSQVQARRVMTELREQSITPLWIERKLG